MMIMTLMHAAVLRRLPLDWLHGNHNVSDVADHLQTLTASPVTF